MLCTRRLLFWSVFLWLNAGISAQKEILCSEPADLGIVLDSSDAISANWLQVLDFANALVEYFNASSNGSHVGIITYGTEAEVAMSFNTFKGDNLSADIVQELIEDLRPKGGHRFIDKALKMANERLFTPEAGMRVHDDDTLKILIVLTAGKQTKNQGSFTLLKDASQPLQDKGLKIYAVGVGSDDDIDVDELIQVAGKRENVLTTDRFEELRLVAEDVSKFACGIKIVEVWRRSPVSAVIAYLYMEMFEEKAVWYPYLHRANVRSGSGT